jgi:hypothetical protein
MEVVVMVVDMVVVSVVLMDMVLVPEGSLDAV